MSFVRVYIFNDNLLEVSGKLLIHHMSDETNAVICISMFVIVLTAVVIGTLMPIALWFLGFDPAHSGMCIANTRVS